jgi:hypothetical protein
MLKSRTDGQKMQHAGQGREIHNILQVNLPGRDQTEDLGADERILLKMILWKESGIDLCGSEY